MDVFHVKITLRVSHRQKPFVKMCFPGICWLNPHDWWRVPQWSILYIYIYSNWKKWWIVCNQKKRAARHGDPTSQAFWCCKLSHFFGATSSKLTKLDQIKNPFYENPLIIPYDKQQSAWIHSSLMPVDYTSLEQNINQPTALKLLSWVYLKIWYPWFTSLQSSCLSKLRFKVDY